jgi:hypothetical protein
VDQNVGGFVYTVMNLVFHINREFRDHLSDYELLKSDLSAHSCANRGGKNDSYVSAYVAYTEIRKLVYRI